MAIETDQNEEQRGKIKDQKNLFWKISMFDENYKLIDPKSSTNSKQSKQKHTKAYHNQIAKNPWKGKNLRSSQKKKKNITYRY